MANLNPPFCVIIIIISIIIKWSGLRNGDRETLITSYNNAHFIPFFRKKEKAKRKTKTLWEGSKETAAEHSDKK